MNDPKKALIAELEILLKRVPPSVVNGSWNLSVKYKDWVVQANKIVKGGRATESVLMALIRQYKSF